MRICTIEPAARDTRFYRLESVKSKALPGAEPGAHVGLALPIGVERQYSLVETSPAPTSYLIGVKRDPRGRGGSRYLFDCAKVGDTLQVSSPQNHFRLVDSADHAVFVAGGIGITPIWSMITRSQALARPWTLIYICRHPEDLLFASDLAERDNVQVHFTQAQGGRPDLKVILDRFDVSSHHYCCGPNALLEAFEKATSDRPRSQVHTEYFTAKQGAATTGGFTVEMARQGRSVFVTSGQTILDALIEAGVAAPHSCLEGVCGQCETGVLAGEPDHRDALLSENERQEGKTMMICCSGSKSERLVLDI
jgi:tetrachlorobenzoquinone reductase